MLRPSLWVFGVACLLATTCLPRESRSWERTLGPNGEPISWPTSCFYYSLQADGSSDIPFDDLQTLTRRAFDAWEDVSCSYFYFMETEPASIAAAEFNLNRGNANLLVFREKVREWDYDPNVIAMTSVNFDKNTNEILDVDIEFNAAYNSFGSLETYPPRTLLIDYLSTLTHEIGHTVGLDHPSNHREATMAPYGGPGETTKRDLAQDDIEGLCSIYPFERDRGICLQPYCGLDLDGTSAKCAKQSGGQDSGCAFAPIKTAGSSLLLRLATLLTL